MLTDVSTEKEYLADLHDIAYTDRLTRLYNRHYGMQELNEWVAEHRASVLCFVDIDNLKCVNDSFGHSEGDNYIVAVAEALRSFSSDAVLCRLGGDEFMVLAQGWKEGKAKEKMEALRTALIGSKLLEGSHYHRGFSYGLIEVSQDNALTVNDLLSVADGRMYEYKHRNKVRAKKKRVP